MDRMQAVYLSQAIGILLEDPQAVKLIERHLGTFGVDQLHKAEMALCKELGVDPFMPK